MNSLRPLMPRRLAAVLVAVVTSSHALSAEPAQTDAQLAASVAALVAHWRTRPADLFSQIAASDLVALMEQLGVDPMSAPDLLRNAVAINDTMRGRSGGECEKDPPPQHPPTDEALARALATLGKKRPPQELFSRVVLEVVGVSTLEFAGPEHEARVVALMKRVKAAGFDLLPVMGPALHARARRRCEELQEPVRSRLEELNIKELEEPTTAVGRSRVPGVTNYVIERRVTETDTVFVATGTGPMKGDVWTTERGYPTSKTEFCETWKGR